MSSNTPIAFNPPPQILKSIEGLEAARVALNAQDKSTYLYKQHIKPIPAILGVIALCGVVVFVFSKMLWLIVPMLMILMSLVFYVFYRIDKRNKALQKHHTSYIQNIIIPMLNEPKNSFNYNRAGSILNKYPSVFKENFSDLQSSQSEDLLEGIVDNTPISVGEIYVEFQKSERVFCFLCCVAELDKNIPSKIIVHSKKTEGTLPQINTTGLQAIALESQAFNRIYQVYAQNAIEARYILTPTVIEKMLALHDTFNGVFWFQNNQMWFLGIDINSNINLFEIREDCPIYEQAKNTYMTVQRLLQMIKTVGANL